VIWGECAIGVGMGLAHWVGGWLYGAPAVNGLAVFYLLSLCGASMFAPRRRTWHVLLEGEPVEGIAAEHAQAGVAPAVSQWAPADPLEATMALGDIPASLTQASAEPLGTDPGLAA